MRIPALACLFTALHLGACAPVPVPLPSCEEARTRYIEDHWHDSGPPELSAGLSMAVLAKSDYLGRCGVPDGMAVEVCTAVENGHVRGVTVQTTPVDAARAACITDAVRGLDFPSHPRLDVSKPTFKAK